MAFAGDALASTLVDLRGDDRYNMGVSDITPMDGDDVLLLDDCEELDVSAALVDRLLSDDLCLIHQLDDCDGGEDDDDQGSLSGTFVGDDDSDESLLSGRTLVDVDESPDETPSIFDKRSDSMCSSFSMRETMTSAASATPCPCTCGRSSGGAKRARVLSASEEYLDATIRYGLSVRVIGIESVEMNSRFLLRVEDLETKRHWEVRKNTKEMAHFYNQIRHICMENAPVKKEMWGTFRGLRKLRLPKKFLHSRGALCYQRRVVYDSLLRHTAALVAPAPMGPRRRQVVALLQEFLDVSAYCDVSDREACNCWFFSARPNATQLVNEIFSDSHHSINQECAEFVAALVKKSYETRRTKLYPRQAQAILRTISKKMTEVKKSLLSDTTLLQQVSTLRQEMPETEFDDFVDDVRRAASGFVQKAVLVELEDHVQEALHVLFTEEEEKLLLPKLRVLQDKKPSLFGVPAHLQKPHDWDDARVEIRRMSDFSLPLDKLKCILRASSAIFRTCSNGAVVDESGIAPALCTDEFLQILFYVVATSNLPRPLRTVQLIRLTCDQDDLTGEMGYYFANFEAAVKLVEEHADWTATVMDQM